MAVFNVDSSAGIDDLGRSVLPANVLPFDFSALDKAVEAENQIANKSLDVIMQNVKDMGRIQDEVTQIVAPTPYHVAELENAKKALGIDKAALVNMVTNIDNPMASYDMDRKMKRLYAHPSVKEIGYANAIVDNFKSGIPNISDPGLRAQAINHLAEITKSSDRDAVKNLNLDQFKPIDLGAAYEEALDRFAPYIPTSEQYQENGVTYTRTVNQRDPEMVARTREYFLKNNVVKNNMMANGFLDASGNLASVAGGKTWFDDMEAPQLVPLEQISNVKGASGGGSSNGKYQYQVPGSLNSLSYKSDIHTDDVTGTTFDLGVIAGAETSNRAPNNVVHMDPNGKGINLGAYSFHAGTGKEFVNFLENHVSAWPDAKAAWDELKTIPLSGGDVKANLARAKAAYGKLEQAMGTENLAKLESEFAINTHGAPIIEYIQTREGLDGIELSQADATILMDSSIQWRPQTWKKWINDYAKLGTDAPPIADYITKRRIEEAVSNANKGLYSMELAQAIGDRAIRVWEAVNRGEQSADGEDSGTTADPAVRNTGTPDVTQFNQYIDPDIAAKADSISGQTAQDAVSYWHTQK